MTDRWDCGHEFDYCDGNCLQCCIDAGKKLARYEAALTCIAHGYELGCDWSDAESIAREALNPSEHKTGHQHASSRERELYEALSALVLYCRQKGVGGAAVERAKALLTGGR